MRKTTPLHRIGTAFGVLLLVALAIVAARFAWPRPPLNVLLVTLDTTRADHIGCYGYRHAATPTLDALAKNGVLFENAYATVPMTLPSHASVLTGLYPPENGLHNNGRGSLGSGFPTIAEILLKRGYETAAFIASVVLRSKAGLNRGFQAYDEEMSGDEPNGDEPHLMRNGKLVVDAALKWLDDRRTRPFFCWVHLYDPHAPFEAHAEIFGDRFRERPYDGDIAYTDIQVGRLIAFLKARDLYDKTLIIVVGDHGEGLGEHLELEHGFMLYNSTMRVPLIVSDPSHGKAGHRVSASVSLVDIFPTLLESLRIAQTERVSGVSLQNAIKGRPIEHRDCYSETDSAFVAYGWAPLRSIATDRWKYVHTTRDELYDLEHDPSELHNLAESQPEQLEEMRQRLAGLEQQMVECPETDVPLTATQRKALESLGYITGVKPAPGQDTAKPLPDVKDMVVHYNAVGEAFLQMQAGMVDEAIRRLNGIIETVPEFLIPRLILGKALVMANRMDEATAVYEAAVNVDTNSHTAQFDLAKHYFSLGQTDKAIEHYEAGLKLDSSDSLSHFTLANIFATKGDVNSARRHFEQGLDASPNSAFGHFNFGMFLETQGDLAGALEHVGRALQLNSRNPQIHFQMGLLLSQKENFAEAAAHFGETLRLNPHYPNAAGQLERARKSLPYQY